MESRRIDRAGFEALLESVNGTFDSRRRNHANLLAELTPHLHAARRVERELDRHLARRFNVFKYLRTDELGLSRIIADLLDPTADHGQGTLFLQAMLDVLPETRGLSGNIRESATKQIKVIVERQLPNNRRIDISVEFPTGDGPYCLAFENKPYAEDQPGQITDYLKFLKKNYGDRFLLVYVPPKDREPDEISISAEELALWSQHFHVMPYADSASSLGSWLAACREHCEIERLEWFLRQAQSFCRQQFGGSSLTTNSETREIRTYLAKFPVHLQAALAIHDAWPIVRAEICEAFLEHLRGKVATRLNEEPNGYTPGLCAQCKYGGEGRYAAALWIARDGWPPYSIKLQSGRQGSAWWHWGVSSLKPLGEMSEDEKKVRLKVTESLSRHRLTIGEDDNHHWPRWEYLQRNENWHQLAPELDAEVKGGSGEITDYYIDGLLRIAKSAIPAIDEVANAGSAN